MLGPANSILGGHETTTLEPGVMIGKKLAVLREEGVLIVGVAIVCWWRTGDAGGAEDRRRAPATTGHRAAA